MPIAVIPKSYASARYLSPVGASVAPARGVGTIDAGDRFAEFDSHTAPGLPGRGRSRPLEM
jgi:hypothetical protein